MTDGRSAPAPRPTRTLLVQVSAEDGFGWTVIAIDRKTREWSVAQRLRQNDAAAAAYELLYKE
jgi:hypothetical protein